MRWWLTENGGRQPYPLSCLTAIAATVLCVLSVLNLCATLSLADQRHHIEHAKSILDSSNSGPSGPSRTDRSTKLNGSGKSKSASGVLRHFYSGRGKEWGDTDRNQGEWDEQYGRRMDPRQRYGSYKDSLSRKWKTSKQIEGTDLDAPQPRSRTALEPFCNKTETRSVLVCELCDNTQPCPLDSQPRKTFDVCVLREEDGHITNGCSFDCQKDISVPECCDGFWGSQCQRKYIAKMVGTRPKRFVFQADTVI